MDKCIYCDSDKNLNTQMTISYKDTKVTVSICDEHAEDATIKSARAAFEEKQHKIEEFLEQAKLLGIKVETGPGGLFIGNQQTTQQTPQQTPQPVPQPVSQPVQLDGDDVVDTSKLNKQMHSVGGSTQFGNIPSHSSYVVAGEHDTLPEEVLKGKAKLTMVEGRGGAPIAIPSRRVDGTGTTNITIIQKENDQSLQRRFKNMADRSITDRPPNFAQGYGDSTATCPLCRGACVIKEDTCPKCGGIGIISTL